MQTASIPTAAELRALMAPLKRQDVLTLANRSGVSFHTLRKLQTGETASPALDTVAQLYPHLVAYVGQGARGR